MTVGLDASELHTRIGQVAHPACLDTIIPDEARRIDGLEEHLTRAQLCQALESTGVIDDQSVRMRHVDRREQRCELGLAGELTHDFRGRSAARETCGEPWR